MRWPFGAGRQASRGRPRDDQAAAPGEPFIICENLVKIYKADELEVLALQGLDLTVRRGELMAIIGSSGSGKSTLLNILGGLDTPTAGKARVAGWDLNRMSPADRVQYKRQTVGFVWQAVGRNLVPYLTALENVMLPMLLAGRYDPSWARELLEAVGLGHRIHHRPMQMSGGEQQRVAIAIGLANHPPVLLADEPTGSLDTVTGQRVLEVFRDVRDRYGVTIVVVTHDRSMARAVDRYVQIRDGKTSTESVRRADPPSQPGAGETGDATAAGDAPTHDEYTLLDSAGRLQLPQDVREALGIKDRVRLRLADGRIVLEPPEPAQDGQAPSPGDAAS
ncbi:MAG TPA: ATP-binding cassette domain-containing protein [Limnochordia bacterium]